MDKLKLKINGVEKFYDNEIYSIKNLLDKENINIQGVAISLNRVFVPKNKISNIVLKNNDDIEIVTPYEGG
ncbi:sulfur carrier protein ThiS [Silvanigrella paludirubra]|jgi:thiamine biosynthesis protein ThiS|uniref:Sulfur carrier protein ThiS n=1 Tax=Silvanigrella paludirubra TaxID=2499159 RepID=A0A6N6VXM3_9BACT|nr:sulfur carrier protein ThiS [Silvanigrella paludirubra]KAB8040487.1 sulfur carrier protein ThiS [Silvanigrella paludirubra]